MARKRNSGSTFANYLHVFEEQMEILSNTLSKVPILHLGRIWYFKPDGLGLILISMRCHGTEGTYADLTSYILYYKRCFRIETVLAGVKLEWMHSLKKDERISSYPEYPMR